MPPYPQRDLTEIEPGELRHRVSLQEDQGSTIDTHGQRTESWQTIATVWAKVEPITGNEFYWAQQVVGESDTKVTIRYREGVDNTKRFLYGSQVLNIVNVSDIEARRRKIVCLCKTFVP